MNGIRDLLYVRFQVPDLQQQVQFLRDFGMQAELVDGRLLARGTDADRCVYVADQGDAQFVGIGFEALSAQALQQLADFDQVPIEPCPLPGGGDMLSLTDPDGFCVEVVFGGEAVPPLPVNLRNPVNHALAQPRLGDRVALPDNPVSVKRLGHCVRMVTNFRESEAWYKERFGLLTSDEVYAGSEDNVLGAFLRCNRGEMHVDHHTLFLIGAGQPGFNHAAFEVLDWDTLMAGHFELAAAGYTHSWGVGKHLLGSQVFDYWKDPHGFSMEHFTDGDLVNESFGSHRAPIETALGNHWGPQGSPD